MNKNTITLIEASNGHFYKIEGDEFMEPLELPSSTTILTAFPNPGLDMWFKNTSAEEIKRKQDEGMIQGTKVHKIIELRIMGKTVLGKGLSNDNISSLGLSEPGLIRYLKEPLTKREEEAQEGIENFWDELKPKTIASEIMVYNPLWTDIKTGKLISKARYENLSAEKKVDYVCQGFAGTLDWIGYLWDKKTKKYDLWIVDWKISKALSASYDLQLCSYWKAFETTYGKNYPNLRIGILQLGKNKCKYSFKEIKNKRGDSSKDKNHAKKLAWEMFLHTKALHDYLHPNNKPRVEVRREQFDALNSYKKKGKSIKIN